ncbi:DNA helicase [Ranunculus cassubicifolius]
MANVIQSGCELKADGILKGSHIGSKWSSSPGLGKKRLDARSYKVSLLKRHEKRSQESVPIKKQKKQGEASQEDSEHVEASSSKQVDEIYEVAVRNREEVGVNNDTEGSDRENEKPLCNEFDSPSSKFTLSSKPAPVLSMKKVASIAELQPVCSSKGNVAEVSLGTTNERTPDSGGSYSENFRTVGTFKRERNSVELDSDDPIAEANEVINSSAEPVTSQPQSNMASILEHCDACSERQRSEGTSENCNMCSCNYVKNRDACNNSSLEVEDELSSKACIGINDEFYDKVQPMKSLTDTNTDSELSSCIICKLGGKLLSCNGRGCKTNYHIYCLVPPLKVVPPGVWHCLKCIKKKIQFGVHSVSEGIESVCDVREEEVPDCAGFQKQTQYWVKYKGLAHVHSRWVPEHELFLEAPSLVSKFKKTQTPKWKPEWSKPQRIVLKRILMSPTQYDGSPDGCQCEWFVKWAGLGYEHATWELENASFLRSSEAISLIREYESRHERAIWASDPTNEKLLEEKKHTSFKLLELPGSNTSGLHNDHLNFVNKLRECWSRNENAVVVENQERILKLISFIHSMESDVCRPFLVISTPCSISAWESEFMRVAPSVNVVTYNGNKDVREIIRGLEFYEGGGCVMLQVLLAPIDAVIEDLEALEFIGWEAIIVDECQLPRVSRHFEQINKLTHIFKILLLSGRVKETIAEYLNILTFVEPGGDWKLDGNLKDDSGDTMSKLKERFARFIACEEKLESSKFVEYWVPVQLSSVQREQYCAALFANSVLLQSSSKTDLLGALAEVLKSVQRCCDHPYLVDSLLQSLLRKDLSEVKYLDVDVNASGKIQVLDKILLEIKKRGLRVLILFQSADFKRNYIGELLEDLLRHRFGHESYERIDNGLSASKKQAAVNMFNNRERGRFVFLSDYRACKQSVKLSSVDSVILFNSSWNPLDDLKALRKISIDSQFEQINVFRLYSCCTVEEKVLSLAKQAVALDSNNIRNISCSTSHLLLLWGAHFQFHKLDEFHSGCTPSSDSNIQQSFVNDLVQEMLSQLRGASETSELKSCNIIAEAPQRGEAYAEDIPLAGENEMLSKDEELPHIAWKHLFDGRYPQWRYASAPFQRIRRKVQNFDELSEIPQENEEPPKKRKKVVSNTNDSSTLKCCFGDKRKSMSMDKEGVSATLSNTQNDLASTDNENIVEHNLSDNWHDSQKNLYLSLKPLISNLCEILHLPDQVKSMAGRFLEYIMNNHRVNPEPVSIYHAFQISLCWSAASLSNYKVSRRNTVSIVKQHLDFQCSEEETQKVYSKLQMLSEMFRQQAMGGKSNFTENPSVDDKTKLCLQSKSSQSNSSSQQHLGGVISDNSESQKCSTPLGSPQHRPTSDCEKASSSFEKVSSKRIEHVKEIHSQRMKKLYQKQQEEFKEFRKYREMIMEKQRAELEVKCKTESAQIHKLHTKSSVKSEKQKKLDEEITRKKEDLDNRLKSEQGKLEDMQKKARSEEKQKRAHWLEVAESGRSVSAYDKLPLSDSGFSLENMEEVGKGVLDDDAKGSGSVEEGIDDCEEDCNDKLTTSYTSSSEKHDPHGDVSVSSAEVVAVENCTTENPPLVAVQSGEMDVNMNTSVSEYASDMADQEHARQTLLGPVAYQEHAAPAQDSQSPSTQIPVSEHAELSFPSDSVVSFDQVTDGINNQPSRKPLVIEEVPRQRPLIENQRQTSVQKSQGPSIGQFQSQVPAQQSEGPPIEQIQPPVPEQIQPPVPSTTCATSLLLENHAASQRIRVLPDSLSIVQTPPPSFQHTVSQPSARSIPTQPQILDPLQNELGRLRREQEQTAQMHENEKKRIRTECEKAIEVIRNKYNYKLQQAEMELAQKKKALETSYNMVYKNRMLAEAFKLKAVCPGVHQSQSTMQQQRPTTTTLGPSRAAPPLQTVYQPSALFSSNPVRSPLTPIIQAHGRAPAPHLQQRYRPARPPHPYMLPNTQPCGSNPTYASAAQHYQPLQRPMQPSSQQEASYNQYGLSSLELLADMIPNANPNSNPNPDPSPFPPRGN